MYIMNWKEWVSSKEKYYLAVILFILAYIATIPIRNYEFLNNFIDTTQGVSFLVHLKLVIAGLIVLVVLLKTIEIIVKYIIKKNSNN